MVMWSTCAWSTPPKYVTYEYDEGDRNHNVAQNAPIRTVAWLQRGSLACPARTVTSHRAHVSSSSGVSPPSRTSGIRSHK